MNVRALLDHPWPLHEAFNAGSPAHLVLLEFDRLIRTRGLDPVPFVTPAQLSDAITQLDHRHSGAAQWRRFAAQLIQEEFSAAPAIPEPDLPPSGLTDEWRSALGQEMLSEEWRRPVIVHPVTRNSDWSTQDEVRIRYSYGTEQRESYRVLARLDRYDVHRYAAADDDPWDLRHIAAAPQAGVSACRLPRPPVLEGVGLGDLVPRLSEIRTQAFNSTDTYYFVPPDSWRPEAVAKDAWRRGRTFEHGHSYEGHGPGPVDSNGRVWVWDRAHEQTNPHWDVQPANESDRRRMGGSYWRVTQSGRKF